MPTFVLLHATADAAVAAWAADLLSRHPRVSLSAGHQLVGHARQEGASAAYSSGVLLAEDSEAPGVVSSLQRALATSAGRVLVLQWRNPLLRAVHWDPLLRAVHWLGPGTAREAAGRPSSSEVSLSQLKATLAAGEHSDAQCARLAARLAAGRGAKGGTKSTGRSGRLAAPLVVQVEDLSLTLTLTLTLNPNPNPGCAGG